MALRLRLLPIVICAASALLAVKLVDLESTAVAETRDAGATPADAAKPSLAAASPGPASPAPAAAAQGAAAQGAGAQTAAAAAPPAADSQAMIDPLQMSPAEVDELQQLSARRVELDKRAAELSEREVLLAATEKRVDDKITKLQALEKSIESDVKSKNAEDDAKIESLGHMYEQMKPQDAARILEQLDVPVLITMLSHIRELKAAPILAAMDPAKAKAVTLAMTEEKNGSATGSAPATGAVAAAAPQADPLPPQQP